jgi:hypothetical protein
MLTHNVSRPASGFVRSYERLRDALEVGRKIVQFVAVQTQVLLHARNVSVALVVTISTSTRAEDVDVKGKESHNVGLVYLFEHIT